MAEQSLLKPGSLEFEYAGKTYKGEGLPVRETCHDGVCFVHRIGYPIDALGISINAQDLSITVKKKLATIRGEFYQLV
jgi:hypothetical protein